MRIASSALRPARGLIGELAAAFAIESHYGTEVEVRGGSRKAVDLTASTADGQIFVDAKALVAITSKRQRESSRATFQFARDLHSPFDETEVTHIALVDLTGCDITLEVLGARPALTSDLSAARVSLVPVAIVNSELMDPTAGADHRWRYVIVPDMYLDRWMLTQQC